MLLTSKISKEKSNSKWIFPIFDMHDVKLLIITKIIDVA